ncbi:ABC transporter ATP-binding protein/permease [Skermania piniformis]|uniref:ATP-binding cassette domain-containing protein n=1 Tax=Skermania pinensis TaxID=39122 RepID=A0ABX8S8Y2_9ACTN|nr:ATP-binding cassette domain-containing protein [Skermania piniformis]QXQ13457.1 ATP-binding cassette domain-containing protein [Skermania piniformis]
MKPVDPRLLRDSAAVRVHLGYSTLLAVLDAVAIVIVATTAAAAVSAIVARTAPEGADLVALVVALGLRVGLTLAGNRQGDRAADTVIDQLENRVLQHVVTLAPRELERTRTRATVLVTTGLRALRPYLSGYLPALLAAVLVPPVVLVGIARADLMSAAIVLVTLPLIPVFMVLIGLLTRGRAAATLDRMTRLSGRTLDLVAGLPTLRALNRAGGPAARIAELGAAYRQTALGGLRIAFLSALVLELVATLSVALVAVGIGMRLVFGEVGLQAALVALILAPEAYRPLRTLGERYHAAEDGLAALDSAYALLAVPAGAASGTGRPEVPLGVLQWQDVAVAGRSGMAPAGLTALARPGRVTVLTGGNGAGKSTAFDVALGLLAPDRGRVLVDGVPLPELDLDWWWSRVAWLPQRPTVLPAAAGTAIDLLDRTELSLGERQRLALDRVLAADAPVLLLDEPTAHLDDEREAAVLAALRERARAGATVVLIGHRPAVLAAADEVIAVVPGDAVVPGVGMVIDG